ncbi:MAG: histidine phosphatase family protein [Vicinamibacterales bacterium]
MPTIYLIRHAYADWTPSDDRPLSAQGQAAAVALAERFDSRSIASIFSSPSRRALDTVAPLAARRQLPPSVLHDLRERELTLPAGLTFEQAVARTWTEPESALPASESNRVAQKRGLSAVKGILAAHPSEDVAISTHGNLLALIVNGFDGRFGYEFWQELTFPDAYAARFNGDTLVDLQRIWETA